MCGGDPRTACFYTSIVEIVDGFIGFCVACSALKFQEKFNDAIDSYTDYGHAIDNSSPINVASVGAFFFFVAIITGAMGVHGYRSRNRWFFLLHILFALLIVLCFFALFIHSLVQFNKMHSHVEEAKEIYDDYHSSLNKTEAADEHKLEKLAATIANEVKQRLVFPVILYFVNLALFMSSALFAWRSWKQLIDGSSTGMKPFENEDERPSPIE